MSTATAKRPGRPRSADRDEAILSAAVEELIEQGYFGMSMEAVATRAGVAKTTLYRRWPSKDDLVLAAIGDVKGPLPVLKGESLRDDLATYLHGLRTSWLGSDHGRLMHRLSADGMGRPDLYQRFRAEVIKPRQQLLMDALRRAADRGEIRADFDPQWVNDLLVSPIVVTTFTHRPRLSAAQVDFAIDVVMQWLTTGVTQARP